MSVLPDAGELLPPRPTAQHQPQPQQSRRTIGRAALWSVLSLGAAQLLSMLVVLVTTRFVSAESFGILAVSITTVELLKRVFVAPFALATTANRQVSDEDYDACFILTLASSIVVAAMLALAAPLVTGLLQRETLGLAMSFISLLLVTTGLSLTHEAWLSRRMQFKALALRSSGAMLAGGVTGILLAVYGFDLWALVAQQIVGSLVSLALLWRATSWRPRLRASRAALRASIESSRSMGLGAIGGFVGSEADIYVASALLGDRAAGIYSIAKRLILAMNTVLSTSIQRLSVVVLANMRDREAEASVLLQAVTIVFAISVACGTAVAVLAQDIVQVLLSDEWRAAAPILAALAVGASISAVGQIINAVLLTNKRARLAAGLSWLAALITLILLPISARYGSVALAAAATLVQLIAFPMRAWFALEATMLKRRAFFGALAPTIVSAALAAGAVVVVRRQVEMNSLQALLLLLPAGAAVYFGVLHLIDRRTTVALFATFRQIISFK